MSKREGEKAEEERKRETIKEVPVKYDGRNTNYARHVLLASVTRRNVVIFIRRESSSCANTAESFTDSSRSCAYFMKTSFANRISVAFT